MKTIFAGVATFVVLAGVAHAGRCTDEAAVAAARMVASSECDCAGAPNHGHYVRCVREVAAGLVETGALPKECHGEVVSCAARSTCGKAGAVTCCRIDRRGRARCSIKSSAAKCNAPRGGATCVGEGSCCDGCTSGGSPDGSFVCSTTTTAAPTTTTAAPTTTTAAPTTTTAAPTTTTAAPTTTTAAPTTTTAAPTTTTAAPTTTTTSTLPGSASPAFVDS